MAQNRCFLIMHGLGNYQPPGHWQWWLAHELERRGERVLYPQLPEPDRPNLRRWLDALVAEYRGMGELERIVVCHSLACALWYQASARGLIRPPAHRVLLVAPPGPSELAHPITEEFWNGPWDAGALSQSCLSTIRLVASERDPYCAEGAAAVVYGLPLRLDAETVAGAGHFDTVAGYGPWPLALRWCLDASTRFVEPSTGALPPASEQQSDPPTGSSPDHRITGSCLCGGVRFEVTAPFRRANYCHCSRCRKHSGAGALAQARVARGGFRLLHGANLVETYRPANGMAKAFCRVCGSSLFGGSWPVGDEVSIRLGTLDDDPGIRPQYHSFVGSRAPWEPLPADGLERFPGPAPSHLASGLVARDSEA